MTGQELIRSRRTVRRYNDRPIEKEIFDAVFDNVRFAPSWKNTQTARYTVLQGEKKAEFIEKALTVWPRNASIAEQAAAVIVVSTVHGLAGFNDDGSYTTAKEDRWEVFDAGIATQQLCLALHAEGVGSVIMGLFDEKAAHELAQLPENEIVSVVVCCGYPLDEAKCPPKKEKEEIVRYL